MLHMTLRLYKSQPHGGSPLEPGSQPLSCAPYQPVIRKQ